MNSIALKNFFIGKGHPLAFILGPCVIESEQQCLESVEFLKDLFLKREVNFIFKSSYDKANRSSVYSYRGPGVKEGLRILNKAKEKYNVPILTDVHSPEEAKEAAEVCDIIQIPAFLCRQTDLLVAAGKTNKIVNVKKGQFMDPWGMRYVIEKILSTGNNKVIVTDRGTSFGYNNLVSDMRGIAVMQGFKTPVCFDATHSVQLPGGQGETSGGQNEFVPLLAKAAVAAGCDCIFMETHDNPLQAKSDKSAMIPFKDLPILLDCLERIHNVIQE